MQLPASSAVGSTIAPGSGALPSFQSIEHDRVCPGVSVNDATRVTFAPPSAIGTGGTATTVGDTIGAVLLPQLEHCGSSTPAHWPDALHESAVVQEIPSSQEAPTEAWLEAHEPAPSQPSGPSHWLLEGSPHVVPAGWNP